MRSKINRFNVFGKTIYYQIMDTVAWIAVKQGDDYWAYTNDKRKTLNIIKNKVNKYVHVENVSSEDLMTLMNHFTCRADDVNDFKENVLSQYYI